ncbi:MAG: NAD(P)H-hydrate dehydratase [Spirochaetales bacterium]|jgi:ADP-dependent NAD(P)H-hydrate dehydratase / NAD(P)H-hydrate epimerase|nr:NAD(P)H-hydrate dehydratase [Spirochaetales bacterium]
MKIVDSAAMTDIDRRAQTDFSIPAQILMENAGIKAYLACKAEFGLFSSHRHLVFISGSGNNGGDALVMARQASLDGYEPVVVLAEPMKSVTAKLNLEIAQKLNIPIFDYPSEGEEITDLLNKSTLIFDGLFGTGIKGQLRSSVSSLVLEINQSAAKVISIDLPSGLGDDFRPGFPIVQADITLCLGLPKRCLFLPKARSACGKIIYVPIGFPGELTRAPDIAGELLDCSDLLSILPPISDDSYKNSRGRLAVFAGSVGTAGASILAAHAAARSRCGLVDLFIDRAAYPQAASQLISVMPHPWEHDDDTSIIDLSRFSAFLAGPGWGLNGRERWLIALIASKLHGVIDADGLRILASMSQRPNLECRVILTPHPGEAALLSGTGSDEILDRPVEAGLEISSAYNAIVVLKSHVTVICAPTGRYWILDGMNPALGTAGSGDVLAGIIAGALAVCGDTLLAARIGVLVHSLAGLKTRSSAGWFLAEDLLPCISRIFEEGS